MIFKVSHDLTLALCLFLSLKDVSHYWFRLFDKNIGEEVKTPPKGLRLEPVSLSASWSGASVMRTPRPALWEEIFSG